jgi:hypothetical protein
VTFAWYGFSVEHPEEWAPVTLSGARQEGYVRIASPGRQSLQVRWKASKNDVDLEAVLGVYLDRLSRDAKNAKSEFRSQIDREDSRLTYRYSSVTHGRGAILQSKPCGRVFFIEAISTKNDSLLPAFRKFLDSFEVVCGKEQWALYGLNLKLPSGLEVDKKVFQAGRTELILSCKAARIEAQRWGFAEQLVAKHGLEPWARSVLELPKSASKTTEAGVEFHRNGSLLKPPVYAIAQIQPDRNQIATVKVTTRDKTWRPAWDWFA